MSENYIVINGKKAELTDEQMKALGIAHKRKNPFKSVGYDKNYYYTDCFGTIVQTTDNCNAVSARFQNAANYFNDETFAKQVALHQLLYRKLLKFSYDNGYHDTAEWNGLNRHWGVYYNVETHQFAVDCYGSHKRVGYWFSSGVGAARAIDEVIRPFMREHPEFVW